ncbi:hypothetical protein AB1278_00195, partial [Chryseobacterium sp. NRRL B-14798]|uniref:hypothetical protein n=1 Tax=Chryseobacterium sp. NRRL B-14798 TaxID=3162880 RepID=UPI003D25A3BB
ELRNALEHLGEISGEVTNDEVLGIFFLSFVLGNRSNLLYHILRILNSKYKTAFLRLFFFVYGRLYLCLIPSEACSLRAFC